MYLSTFFTHAICPSFYYIHISFLSSLNVLSFFAKIHNQKEVCPTFRTFNDSSILHYFSQTFIIKQQSRFSYSLPIWINLSLNYILKARFFFLKWIQFSLDIGSMNGYSFPLICLYHLTEKCVPVLHLFRISKCIPGFSSRG